MQHVQDGDLSPIYCRLYRQVAALPAIQNIQERMLKDIRGATIRLDRFETKEGYTSGLVMIFTSVQLRDRTDGVEFQATGEDPGIPIADKHLVTGDELLEIYFDKVGRTDKPIRPHGLVKESTVRDGAAPRDKNQFTPWMLSTLFRNSEYRKAKERAQQRLAREILTQLAQNSEFVAMSEEVSMATIIARLREYSHLPPEVLHRAIDLMYVEATMEK